MKNLKSSFLFLLLLIVLIFGCNSKHNNVTIEDKKSIDYYFYKGKNKTLSLENRLLFIDSIFKKKISLKTDSIFLASIALKSTLHYRLKQYDSTLFYDKKLLYRAIEASNSYFIGKASFNLAINFQQKNAYDSAFYYYNQSKTHFKILNNESQVGKRLLSMSIIQQNQSDFIGSKETITEALQYLQINKSTKYLASSYSVLATNHQRLLNYSDAIHYYKQAVLTTSQKKDKLAYQNNLATVYIDSKHYQNAITLLKRLEQDSLLKKRYNQYARVIDNLAYAKWLHQEKNILPTFLKALDLRVLHNDKRGQIASYLHLGEYYLGTNKQKSKNYLNKAILTSKQIKNPKGEIEALQFLMKLNPINIAIKDRYISLNDSLYKQELKAKTQFAKYKYDDKVKQETITNLMLNKKLDALEIFKQKNQKIIFILLGLITIILGFIIVYFLKLKHKKEKLKEVYNTETRISQKVHDELANDVYNVMNRIQNNSTLQQKDVLNQLEDIYKRTRDISYQNGTINLESNYYVLELKDMINAYQNESTKITTIGLNQAIFENIANHKKIITERILKELMTNMKKHSKASNVVFNFKKDNRNVYIKYTDDGIGFKKSNLTKQNGLQNAENRIKNINGSFNFDSNTEKGVVINILFPV